MMDPERRRLREADAGLIPWKSWGPYVSERQWGTVREDYSADGSAWEYFPHDHARSRAYRWGEDGLAAICDEHCRLCLGLVLWNGQDPILKERLFGLTNSQGNHGEDVKELYWRLDATPTGSYLKMLYKYPQRAFPYELLVEENRRRGREQPEFELLDTGVFDDDRYFDVIVEHAKAGPVDLLMRVTAHNRGPEAAPLHLLPQLWFRNTWSWAPNRPRPLLSAVGRGAVHAQHRRLGEFLFQADGSPELLFCENETNVERLFGAAQSPSYPKDAFHDFIVRGQRGVVNPQQEGTKAAAHYVFKVAAGGSAQVRVRLTLTAPPPRPTEERSGVASGPETPVRPAAARGGKAGHPPSFADFDAILEKRQQEADAFYAPLQKGMANADERLVQRQAFAGLLWTKQYYGYDVPRWLRGDPAQPAPPRERRQGRNHEWLHLNNADVISMPDKWEYPWYAAWDLAFHCVPMAAIDPEFAKHQLILLSREWYMHPNGQLPAYEWALGDVNPPVHAWAAYSVFRIDRQQRGDLGDVTFLERIFHKLMLNFTWWVNRKDATGKNLFQGGFLGMDNIGVYDRSMRLADGLRVDQADGTSWMAMYSLNLMRIALELALHDPAYEDIATKFFEHFLNIAQAMTNFGCADPLDPPPGGGLWDEADQFFYDQASLPDGRTMKLKIRSMVGLVPLFAVETLEPETLQRLDGFSRRLKWFLDYRPDLAALVSRWYEPGRGDRRLLSLLRGHRMKALLRRMLDPNEFLSDHGVRSLSRFHRDQPYVLELGGRELRVDYEPGESTTTVFGGNSNWRGPVWFPVNFLLIEALHRFHSYYGDDFKVECPTGSGEYLTLGEVAAELTRRLASLFVKDRAGRRPIYGGAEKLQDDPQFRDLISFYEHFDGDTGRGLGASQQTGWTAVIARLLQPSMADLPVAECIRRIDAARRAGAKP